MVNGESGGFPPGSARKVHVPVRTATSTAEEFVSFSADASLAQCVIPTCDL